MMTIFAASALVLLQAGTAPAAATAATEINDVAFEAIAAGRTSDAIDKIQQLLAEQPEDPALLINLAAAHLQRGEYEYAAQAYQRAVESDDRYRLELADGSWMDSRLAARRGLEALQDHRALAMR